MSIKYGTNEFSDEQLAHLDEVIDAAETLLRLLSVKPDYLADENLVSVEENNYPFHPLDIVKVVVDRLEEESCNAFLPVHIETETVEGFMVDFVSDTFHKPIYKKEEE